MMKVFSAGWYNYIAQETQEVRIKAKDIIEAKETMILYMNNRLGHGKHTYTESDIEFIHEEYDSYLTYEEEYKKYVFDFKQEPSKELLDWEDKNDDIEWYRSHDA